MCEYFSLPHFQDSPSVQARHSRGYWCIYMCISAWPVATPCPQVPTSPNTVEAIDLILCLCVFQLALRLSPAPQVSASPGTVKAINICMCVFQLAPWPAPTPHAPPTRSRLPRHSRSHCSRPSGTRSRWHHEESAQNFCRNIWWYVIWIIYYLTHRNSNHLVWMCTNWIKEITNNCMVQWDCTNLLRKISLLSHVKTDCQEYSHHFKIIFWLEIKPFCWH